MFSFRDRDQDRETDGEDRDTINRREERFVTRRNGPISSATQVCFFHTKASMNSHTFLILKSMENGIYTYKV